MAVTGFLSSVILMAGAAVFSRYEGWSYMDSFYYSFVTLTTIGFGDFVALQVRTVVNVIKVFNPSIKDSSALTRCKISNSHRILEDSLGIFFTIL